MEFIGKKKEAVLEKQFLRKWGRKFLIIILI